MHFTDTHCHIHEAGGVGDDPVHQKWVQGGKDDADAMIADAAKVGVTQMICVGTDVADSKLAVDFVQERPQCWASIGIHPHEASRYVHDHAALKEFAALADQPKVVAVGECGLDYYYNHSPKKAQITMLRYQIELAIKHHLPLIFHVRDAFDDFWPILDEYPGLRGVIHSFTADQQVLEQILQRNLYVGLNGIMTFTKNDQQLAAAKQVPSEHLLLETDAPFLTPAPERGKLCEPQHVRLTAEFLSKLRAESLDSIAQHSTANARALFFERHNYGRSSTR